MAETWRRVWGEGQNFRRPRWRFFRKNFHFSGKNFWWLFLVIDQVFRIFTVCPDLYFVHDPFLKRKTPFFTLFILSRTSDNTTSQNIGGDECMGRFFTSNFGGPSPAVPLRFPTLRLPNAAFVRRREIFVAIVQFVKILYSSFSFVCSQIFFRHLSFSLAPGTTLRLWIL